MYFFFSIFKPFLKQKPFKKDRKKKVLRQNLISRIKQYIHHEVIKSGTFWRQIERKEKLCCAQFIFNTLLFVINLVQRE